MRASLDWTRDENLADAMQPAILFQTIATCRLPVVGIIHGAALGGGVGLAACCDIAIAAEGTKFGFSEVKLGIIPATISPYVIAKIGRSQAQALFVTGERFDALRALAIGLIHQVVPAAELDAALGATLAQLRANSPRAMRAAKQLALRVPEVAATEVIDYTVNALADIRVTPEAQEGLRAFLAKRQAAWVEEA
jgi:methylglutaconyl-CoA hydratase